VLNSFYFARERRNRKEKRGRERKRERERERERKGKKVSVSRLGYKSHRGAYQSGIFVRSTEPFPLP